MQDYYLKGSTGRTGTGRRGRNSLNSNGFTLIEAIIALAVAAILAAIATPLYSNWVANAQFRESARSLASALREARSQAVSTNLEHQVEVDLPGNRYRLTQGARSKDSPQPFTRVIFDWVQLPAVVALKRNVDCSETSHTNGVTNSTNLQFNPDGTGTSQYICIIEKNSATRKYRVGVPSPITGRVVIEK